MSFSRTVASLVPSTECATAGGNRGQGEEKTEIGIQ